MRFQNIKTSEGKFIIKYRWWIIGLSLSITLIFGLQIPRAEFDPDVENYIPQSMASRINTQKIEDIFGGNEILLVVLQTNDILNTESLKRLQILSDEFTEMEGASKVLSLFNSKNLKGEYGMMIVDPAVPEIPETLEDREALRKELDNNKMVMKVVISDDFTMSAIILLIDESIKKDEFLQEVKQILEKNPGNEEVFLGGLPYIAAVISKAMSRDMMVLLPMALVIMLFMLYFFFKQKRGVILPFSVVIMSIIITMGMFPLFGWKISIISVLLPVILVAVANDYGIHLVAHYQELAKAEGVNAKPFKLSIRIYQNLKRPIFLTGLTTIAGLLSLLSHRMLPARQLGVLSAIGIAIALIMSLLFIPAVLSFFKKPLTGKTLYTKKKDNLAIFLSWLGNLVSHHTVKVLIFSVSLTILSGAGIYFLKVDTNVVNFFPKHHSIRKATNLINEHFGGSQTISILVEGDMKDPDLLKQMDNYGKQFSKIQGVGSVASLSKVVLEISKVLNDKGDPEYNKIPDSRDFVAQYLGLYAMNGDESDFDQLVDYDYLHGRIIITLNNSDNHVVKNIIKKTSEITRGNPHITLMGGHAYINLEMADLVIRGQMYSLLIAIIIIGALVSFIFKAPSAGLIAMIPITMAVLFLFGIMGFFGIRLDIATALLSSMMIGIGVDYTIHFLWRYKVERCAKLNPKQAVRKTLETTGRGILFNALSVIIGFSVLLFSSFPPIRFFGLLVLLSIIACLAGAFLVIPGILIIWKPAFMEPGGVKHKKTEIILNETPVLDE
ncbi:MAG: RND family transporter [Bacteroidales bacterium]|nr:RND family transporter [Bacteroidales bacterium]